MSTVEPLNSEPELLTKPQHTDKVICTCQCHVCNLPILSPSLEEKEKNEENNDTEEDDENNDTEEEEPHPLYTRIENSGIFLVSVNHRPLFYCQTRQEAVDQATDFLRNLPQDLGSYTYCIDQEDDEIVLTSRYKWFVIQYDTVESTATIKEISRVQFTNEEKPKTE